MKGLVVGCVIGHIKNYNFARGYIYEGANIGFGPYTFNMYSRDMNDPSYKRSH